MSECMHQQILTQLQSDNTTWITECLECGKTLSDPEIEARKRGRATELTTKINKLADMLGEYLGTKEADNA